MKNCLFSKYCALVFIASLLSHPVWLRAQERTVGPQEAAANFTTTVREGKSEKALEIIVHNIPQWAAFRVGIQSQLDSLNSDRISSLVKQAQTISAQIGGSVGKARDDLYQRHTYNYVNNPAAFFGALRDKDLDHAGYAKHSLWNQIANSDWRSPESRRQAVVRIASQQYDVYSYAHARSADSGTQARVGDRLKVPDQALREGWSQLAIELGRGTELGAVAAAILLEYYLQGSIIARR